MPRKSWLDIVWPVAGISRSVAFEKQPPFTTPDALNVRSDDTAEYRERGGSRPGLGLAVRSQLPGPVRLLTKVAVLKATWPKNYSPLYGNQLNDGITRVAWAPDPTFQSSTSNQGARASLVGADWGVAIPPSFSYGQSLPDPYEVSLFVTPVDGKQLNGLVQINVNLQENEDDPTENGVQCSIQFSESSYFAFITRNQAGVPVQEVTSVTFTDDVGMSGTFYARIIPATRTIQLYWRRNKLTEIVIPTINGNGSSYRVISPDESISVTKLSTDFRWDTSVAIPYRDQRRDVLVAVSNGSIYLEDTADTLSLVAPSAVNPEGELVAVDREQKLFIADYGAAVGGVATGTVAAASYNTLKDTGKNFTSLGIDTNYVIELTNSNYSQNEKQVITLYNTNGGNFRLGFRGAFTSPIPQGSQGSGVTLLLEQLSTIGAGNVIVQGDGGGPWTVEFKGDLAGQDLQLLAYQADDLAADGGTPAIEIVSTQSGADGKYVVGSYQISSVAGDTITFIPAITVSPDFTGDIGSVSYSVVRAPKIFDPYDGSVEIHTASEGFVPAGCRLVTLYRDRIVYAASDLEPHVWYMSRQGDPFDWDYSQEDSAAAVSSQASFGGQLADPITAIIAHGDECLIVGCYNSLWIVRGDPGFGGSMDQLSRKIGIVGPRAWCRTPDDMCVFLSPDGIYVMPAGCHGMPTSLSRERLPDDLIGVNQDRFTVSMEYDLVHRGIHIYLTPTDGSTGNHWWFDWEAKAFWRVGLQNDHEPMSIHERVSWAESPVVLLGCRDGYIRYYSRDFQTDDQDNPIESYCVIGPFHLDRAGYLEGLLTGLKGTLSKSSGDVQWEVLVGDSGESAVNAQPREQGIWNKTGLNYTSRPRVRGVACCIKVSNGSLVKRWILERITAVVRSAGMRRVR